MLNNNKLFIYNLCFGLSKLYTNIQQDQKAKLDYHMSMLSAYMADGEVVGVRGFKMFCQRVSEFFLLALCVCVFGEGGGGGGQVQYLSFREKDNRPPPINKWLVPITKCPMGHYVAYLFLRYFLYSVITGWSQQNALVKSSIGALWPRRPILLWQPLMLVHILGFMTFRPSVI